MSTFLSTFISIFTSYCLGVKVHYIYQSAIIKEIRNNIIYLYIEFLLKAMEG